MFKKYLMTIEQLENIQANQKIWSKIHSDWLWIDSKKWYKLENITDSLQRKDFNIEQHCTFREKVNGMKI